jgi:hypothetical protein
MSKTTANAEEMLNQQAGEVGATDWPEPKQIRAVLHPVTAFDPEALLPEGLREWVMDEADRMPCPPDFIAAAAMVALGAIIGGNCAIKAEEE